MVYVVLFLNVLDTALQGVFCVLLTFYSSMLRLSWFLIKIHHLFIWLFKLQVLKSWLSVSFLLYSSQTNSYLYTVSYQWNIYAFNSRYSLYIVIILVKIWRTKHALS